MSTGRVLQTGTVTPGHAASWTTDCVIQDAGPATDGNLTELGVTKNGGIAIGVNSAPVSNPGGYVQFGVGANQDGVVTIYAASFDGAPAATLLFDVDGTIYPISVASGLALITNIATLRANTSTVSQVYVQGYRTPGDGGQGPFWYNANDTTSADNGGTIIVDANGRRWYRDTVGFFFPEWFGAYGNGTSDDSTAFANMLAAWNGQQIRLSARKYLINTPLSISVAATASMSIAGSGSGATTLLLAGAPGTVGINVALTPGGSFNLSGLTIQRNDASATWGGIGVQVVTQYVIPPGGLRLDDIIMLGNEATTTGWQTGLEIQGPINSDISRFHWVAPLSTTASPTFDGTAIHISGASTSDFAVDNHLESLTCQGGFAGLRVTGYAQGMYVSNFTFIASSYGVYWATQSPSEQLSMSNGHCNNYVTGIYCGLCGWVLIQNVLILRYSPDSGTWVGVDLPESNNITLTNINVYGALMGTEYGIRYVCAGSAGGQPSTIAGCNFAALSAAAVLLGGTTSNTIVTGCNGNSVAGAFEDQNGSNTLVMNNVNGDITDSKLGNILAYKSNLVIGSQMQPFGAGFFVTMGVGTPGASIFAELSANSTGVLTVNASEIILSASTTNAQVQNLLPDATGRNIGTGSQPFTNGTFTNVLLGNASASTFASLGGNSSGQLEMSATNIVIQGLGKYASDSAAAAGGVPLEGLYISSSTGAVQQRQT